MKTARDVIAGPPICTTDGAVVLRRTELNAYINALQKIAFGRTDCGRPLGGENARQIARETLTAYGIQWSGREGE